MAQMGCCVLCHTKMVYCPGRTILDLVLHKQCRIWNTDFRDDMKIMLSTSHVWNVGVTEKICCYFNSLRPELRPTCCWWHFQMHFFERKLLYFNSYFTDNCSIVVPNDSTSGLVPAMALCWTGNKTSPEPVMVPFTNTHTHYQASMS